MKTNDSIPQSAPEGNPFTLERVGADAFVAHVESYDLHLSTPGGTPRTRDLDLAAWLGFERPRNIRKLIRRMESEGKLSDIDWRSTVGRQSTGNGASREFSVTEAWLTREQALLIATQSDTPRAWAVVQVMARVFDAVLEMLRTPARGPDLGDLRAMLAEAVDRATEPLRRELADLRERSAPSLLGESIGRATARESIAKPVRALAGRLVLLDPVFSRKQHIGRLYIELREAIGVSLAPRLEDLDGDKLKAARRWIRARSRGLDLREDAIRGNARRRAADAQGSLGLN